MTDPIRVFLSYGRGDDHLHPADTDPNYHEHRERCFSRQLYEDLTAAGFDVWWDRISLPSRALTFNHEIREAINGCHKLVLVVGPQGMESDYVRAEYEHALNYCLEVLPILRTGDYPLIPAAIGKIDAVDFRDMAYYPQKIETLIRKLRPAPATFGALHGVGDLPEWYIQRHKDLQDVSAKLRSDAEGPVVVSSAGKKLVTLYGMGGLGKSTLATALCQDCDVRRTFSDGIFWLPIGRPTSDDPQQAQTEMESQIIRRMGDIGEAFGVARSEFPDLDRARSVIGRLLGDCAALLVLDDVWDHSHAQPFLLAGSRTRVLITTRLAGLSTLLGGMKHELDTLSEDEALRLFAKRLYKDEQAPLPDPDSLKAIIQLLGHHTLAINIAAAFLRQPGLDNPADLRQSLAEGHVFTDLNMHPTDKDYNLELSLYQSYCALGPDGQRRFRALGVFAMDGTFDVAAVGAVWGDINVFNVKKHLSMLAQAELLTLDNGRYSQHGLLTAYARALLEQAGDCEAAQRAHFEHYEKLHGYRDTNDNEDRHPLIEQDWSNVQAALDWGWLNEARRSCDLSAVALNYFMMLRQPSAVRFAIFQRGLEAAQRVDYRRGEANCIASLGDVHAALSELAEARARYEQALPLYRAIGDRLGEANCIRGLGDVHAALSELAEARARYEEALPLYRAIGDRLGEANCIRGLGDVHAALSELAEARARDEEALPLYRAIGDRLGEANCIRGLGDVHAALSELAEARARYEQALPLYRAIGDRRGEANCIRGLGDVHVRLSELAEARARYEQALPLYRAIGNRRGEANCIASLGAVHRALSELPEARARYAEALPLYRAIGDRLGEANCIQSLGDVHVRLSELPEARARYAEALPLYRAIGDRLGEANCIQSLGDVHRDLSELPEARARYAEALPLYRAIGDRLGEANCIQSLGDVHRDLSELPEARARYAEALPLYRAIGDRLGEANCIQSLGDVHRDLSELPEARARYAEALPLFRAIEEPIGQLNCLSNLARITDDQAAACQLWEQVFALADRYDFLRAHPVVQDWREEYVQLCGGLPSGE